MSWEINRIVYLIYFKEKTMDIQKIYLRQAQLYLNSSLFALIPASIIILLIMIVIPRENLMVLVIPFLIYSLFLFQNYILNYKRFISLSKKNKLVVPDFPDLMSNNQILLYFNKEDRELVFLHPTGVYLGKISEKHGKYSSNKRSRLHPKEMVLIDSNGTLLATFWKSDTIDIHQNGYGYLGGFSSGVFSMLLGDSVGVLSSKYIFLDDYIENGRGEVVFRVRKGWMPLKYQEIFLNPNTPIVTINPSLTDSEKLLYFSLLVNRFF
jgi:hypothetical protein